jgi:hypothetical protein
MKKLLIKITGLLTASVLMFTSCSKKIDEAYKNPNADTRVPVEQLLPQIISAMAANYAGHGTMNDARYVGAYIQNWQFYTTLSNFDRMGYTNNSADVAQSTWRMHYYDIGQNNMKMIEWAKEEKKWDYAGVGQAIFAWSWLTLTDYYGDVILNDAFNTELLTFKYNTQPEVYEYVRDLCFEALSNLNKTGDNVSQANLAKGDAYFYNGDVNKWKKFVYGVLARYYNHQSNKSTYKPDSVIYYANLSILTNADNAMVKFAATPLSATNNFFGPLRGNLTGTGSTAPTAIRQGSYIANLENGTNSAFLGVEDPRAIYLLRLDSNHTFKGVVPNKGQNALAAGDRPENFWGISQYSTTANNTAGPNGQGVLPRFIFRNDAPFPVMTAAEINFMKAEAYFRKGLKAEALASYIEGISQHFDMLTSTYNVNIPAGKEITPTIKANFVSPILNPIVIPSAANLTLSKIMLQKYIAMFGYGVLETWVDMRRFHYTDADPSAVGQVYADFTPPTGTDLFPDNLNSPYTNNPNHYVYRYYPRFNSEYVWNVNELKRIDALTTYYHTKPMWFTEP